MLNRSSLITQILLILSIIASLLYVSMWGYNVVRGMIDHYPTEYRDMATVQLTYLFTTNQNPYNLETNPPFFYLYGFLFGYICGKLNSILSLSPLLINKIIVIVCIVMAAIIIAREVKYLTNSTRLSILSFALMLDSGYNLSCFILRPDALGLLLTVLAIALIRRSQSIPILIVTSVISILSFYTKQYYIYIIVPISLYTLLISPRKFIFYLVFTVLFGTGSFAIISKIFPYYFYATIYAQAQSVDFSFVHLAKQSQEFGKCYFPLFIVVIYQLSVTFRRYMDKKINGRSLLNSPLIIYVLQILIVIICLIKLGGNRGAWMSYYNELLLPPLIVITMVIINEFYQFEGSNKIVRYVFSIRIRAILQLTIALWMCFYGQNSIRLNHYMTSSEESNWKKAYAILDEHASSKMFLSPILANYALMHNIAIYDNGNTEYAFNLTPLAQYATLQKILFPQLGFLNDYYKSYRNKINKQVAQGEFSVVTLTQQLSDTIIDKKILLSKYKLFTIIPLRTGEVWPTEFWLPV